MPALSKTTSLDLGCYLVAKGISLAYCEPTADGKRVALVFNIAQEQLDSLERGFYAGGQVSAVALLNALRQVRRSMDLLLRKEPPHGSR